MSPVSSSSSSDVLVLVRTAFSTSSSTRWTCSVQVREELPRHLFPFASLGPTLYYGTVPNTPFFPQALPLRIVAKLLEGYDEQLGLYVVTAAEEQASRFLRRACSALQNISPPISVADGLQRVRDKGCLVTMESENQHHASSQPRESPVDERKMNLGESLNFLLSAEGYHSLTIVRTVVARSVTKGCTSFKDEYSLFGRATALAEQLLQVVEERLQDGDVVSIGDCGSIFSRLFKERRRGCGGGSHSATAVLELLIQALCDGGEDPGYSAAELVFTMKKKLQDFVDLAEETKSKKSELYALMLRE